MSLFGVDSEPQLMETVLAELRESSLPLFVFGAGTMAAATIHYLRRQKITVEAACVDDQRLRGSTSERVSGLEVLPLSALALRSGGFNLYVACLAAYGEENLARLRRTVNVNKVVLLDGYFIYGCEGLTPAQLQENEASYRDLFETLEDDVSREVLVNFVKARLTGNPRFFSTYEVERQYFPKGIVRLGDDEVFVDCGAFDGGTIVDFVSEVNGRYRSIYAFEPDRDNARRLLDTVKRESLHDIVVLERGVWDSRGRLNFSSGFDEASSISAGGLDMIEVDTIDHVVGANRVSFIKMDIEGAEFRALVGAETTIRRCRPTLAIAAYHRMSDMLTIPRFLNGIDQSYRFYLRAHKPMSIDVVLYAVPGRHPREVS